LIVAVIILGHRSACMSPTLKERWQRATCFVSHIHTLVKLPPAAAFEATVPVVVVVVMPVTVVMGVSEQVSCRECHQHTYEQGDSSCIPTSGLEQAGEGLSCVFLGG
jgi:hypothetical protein